MRAFSGYAGFHSILKLRWNSHEFDGEPGPRPIRGKIFDLANRIRCTIGCA